LSDAKQYTDIQAESALVANGFDMGNVPAPTEECNPIPFSTGLECISTFSFVGTNYMLRDNISGIVNVSNLVTAVSVAVPAGSGYNLGDILIAQNGTLYAGTPLQIQLTAAGWKILNNAVYQTTEPTVFAGGAGSGAQVNVTWQSLAPPTAPPNVFIIIDSIESGGVNYQVGDILNFTGFGATCQVTAVNPSTGAITTANIMESFNAISVPYPFSTLPPSPNTLTGGHGSGAKLNLTFSTHILAASGWFVPGYAYLGQTVFIGAQSLLLDYACCDSTGAEYPRGTYDVYFIGTDNQPVNTGTPLVELFPANAWDVETNWLPGDCPGLGVLCAHIFP
jgi:hypothetical protein